MGGTTEHAGNFVPVDERLVSFFVSQKQECTNGVQKRECRGRSPLPGWEVKPKPFSQKQECRGLRPLPGCEVSPPISFSLAAAGSLKGIILMNVMQQDILQQLEQLQQDAQISLNQTTTTEAVKEWYSEYLSRKGRLTSILRNLGNLPAAERPMVGKVANEVKTALENALQEHQSAIAQAELEAIRRTERVDITLPGLPQNLGKLHITTRVLSDIYAIFTSIVFQIYDSPEVETD